MNLLKIFNAQVGSRLPELVSPLIDKPSELTAAGLNTTLPAVLRALIEKVESIDAVPEFVSRLQETDVPRTRLDLMEEVLTDEIRSKMLIQNGRHVVQYLFGDRMPDMFRTLENTTGFDLECVKTLVQVNAIYFFSFINQMRNNNNLSNVELYNLIQEQSTFASQVTSEQIERQIEESTAAEVEMLEANEEVLHELMELDEPVLESETPINAFRTLLPWILLLVSVLLFIWSLRRWISSS